MSHIGKATITYNVGVFSWMNLVIISQLWQMEMGNVDQNVNGCMEEITTAVHFMYSLMDPDPNWKGCHQHIRLATNIKFAGVNIYGHPNIWCEDQHRLTTKKFFYLELKRNRQLYRLSAEQIMQITIRFPAPPMTNGNNYEKYFPLKLFASHTTRIIISIQLQIKYIWLIKLDFEIFT
jgi:hypothetical protein